MAGLWRQAALQPLVALDGRFLIIATAGSDPYRLLGLRLNRDTERMVLSDLIYDAASPAGWALIEGGTDKERCFLRKYDIQLINADIPALTDANKTASNA